MNEFNISAVLNIMEIILFAVLTVLAIYLIRSLKSFLKSISNIENEVVQISDAMAPVITDLKFITEDVKSVVDSSRIQFEKVKDLSETLIDKGNGLVDAIDNIQNVSNGFLLNTSNFVSAVNKGVKTFGSRLRNRSEIFKTIND